VPTAQAVLKPGSLKRPRDRVEPRRWDLEPGRQQAIDDHGANKPISFDSIRGRTVALRRLLFLTRVGEVASGETVLDALCMAPQGIEGIY
jgi:hypothetical protein